jgi:energy-coupling factor transporter ATP-binding protein EcfA2
MNLEIKSINATAGFLQDCSVEFLPGLNCIIGARGTCKSTLVETIRYVFNHDKDKIDVLMGIAGKGESSHGLIPATLRAGSAHCCIETRGKGESSIYNLERETGSETRIYQEGVREHSKPDILHNIEIFSQGDLQKIAEDTNGSLRINLIDRPNSLEIKRLNDKRCVLSKELSDTGEEIRNVRTNLQSAKQQFLPLVELVHQLEEVKRTCPQLSPELELQRVRFELREHILHECKKLEGLKETISPILSFLQNHIQSVTSVTTFLKSVKGEDLSEAIGIGEDIYKQLIDSASALNVVTNINVAEINSKLSSVFELKNEAYYELRKQEQEANESLKKQQILKKQIELLEKLRLDYEQGIKHQQQLLTKRDDIRNQLSKIDNTIFSSRMKEIESINSEFHDTILLTLNSDTASSGYAYKLSCILSGSRIRGQEDVAIAIARSFPPAKLIDIIEAGEAQILADVLDRDLGPMTRVVAHLADHPDLYTLESDPPAAVLDITMFQDGHPKPVESLSKGQKATALLPLILRPLPYPLIFDQPEDDLDNSFIYRSMVKAIHDLKLKRQLIFVTHNANIPVLGAADRVIVMSMKSPQTAGIPKVGSVDDQKKDILDLLEGGEKAFLEREVKYGLKGE